MNDIPKVSGICTSILYYLVILYPYLFTYNNGKLGWNNHVNDKYNLISTAFEHCEKKLEFLFILSLVVSSSIYFYYKNYFTTDISLAIPILSYYIVFSIFVLIYILPTNFNIIHNIIGILVMISSIILSIFIYLVYKDNDNVDDILINLILIIIFSFLGIGFGLYNGMNRYMYTLPSFKYHKTYIINILGIIEFFIFVLLGVQLILTIDKSKVSLVI